jgi:uncharacterized damage-inducible protein DinB
MRHAFLAEQFESELPLSREVLRAVPAEALDWAPHPKSFPLGRLAIHVATLPGWMPAFAATDAYDMGPGGPGPAVPASVDEILRTFDDAVTKGRRVLATLDDEALGDTWTLLRDGVTVATMTRAEAIARYLIRHAAHHRGQLTLYLRLRGVPVPALYGDSADLRLLPPGAATP